MANGRTTSSLISLVTSAALLVAVIGLPRERSVAASDGSAHGSRTAMRWPFASWGIDVVIAGHDHTYERIARDGITYLVNGLGGGALYGLGTPIEGTVARYAANHGALKLVATPTTIEGWFISVDGVVRDNFQLLNGRPDATPLQTPAPPAQPTPTPIPSAVATRPAGVLKLLPKPGTLTAAGVPILSWRPSSRAVRYEVCVSTLIGRCTTSWRSTMVTRSRVTLPRGATRYWQVRAIGRTGLVTYANSGRWWRVSTR